jgi:two-component system C4-dicarboxylate transport sensor histidine kinase DctB
VASILLLDSDGRVVSATNRNVLGTAYRNAPSFVAAQRANDTIFTATRRENGVAFDFNYSRALRSDGKLRGVIVVSVDLAKYERTWSGLQDAVVVTDSEGAVILSTVPAWRGRDLDAALAANEPLSALSRALKATTDWAQAHARRLSGRRSGDEDRGADPVPRLADRHLHRLRIGARKGERHPGA